MVAPLTDVDVRVKLPFSEPERGQRPLPQEYGLGPQCIGSLDRLEGISRAKVVEVLVEVLVGLDAELAGRDLHTWLDGKAGQQRRRGDGAAAWRVALQRQSAGARRLKYWRHPGGRVEFDSVGHHDDGL